MSEASRDPKREAILGAARAQFTRYGFRRTSMEDIAREAGMSRAALYLHFKNKEAIFRALAESIHEEALSRAESALKSTGSIEERVRGAFAGKIECFLEIVFEATHGEELLDEGNRQSGDLYKSTGERSLRMITEALREATRNGEIDPKAAGLSAAGAAEILSMSVAGIKQGASDIATFRTRLERLLRVFFAGLRSSPN